MLALLGTVACSGAETRKPGFDWQPENTPRVWRDEEGKINSIACARNLNEGEGRAIATARARIAASEYIGGSVVPAMVSRKYGNPEPDTYCVHQKEWR